MHRGDADFERAVDVTIEALRAGAVVAADDDHALMTYTELSRVLAAEGLDVPACGEPISSILEAASIRESDQDRGLISALVILADTQQPGKGFVNLARRRGRQGDEAQIWLNEIRRIRTEAWQVVPPLGDSRRVTADNLNRLAMIYYCRAGDLLGGEDHTYLDSAAAAQISAETTANVPGAAVQVLTVADAIEQVGGQVLQVRAAVEQHERGDGQRQQGVVGSAKPLAPTGRNHP